METFVTKQEKEFFNYVKDVEKCLGYSINDDVKNGFTYNAFIDGNLPEDTAEEIVANDFRGVGFGTPVYETLVFYWEEEKQLRVGKVYYKNNTFYFYTDDDTKIYENPSHWKYGDEIY